MIFTDLYLDNVYKFTDATLDLTFKRPLVYSTIPYEHLPDNPKFYVKRVCILSGANASGKTSLGRVLQAIQSRLHSPVLLAEWLKKSRYHKHKPSVLTVEFATSQPSILHKLNLTLTDDVQFSYQSVKLHSQDSAKKARDKLAKQPIIKDDITISQALTQLQFGWYYLLSENENKHSEIRQADFDVRILKAILQTFDKSIVDVQKTYDDTGQTGFSIRFDNADICLLNLQGELTQSNRFSRGTYDAIAVAHLVSWVMADMSNMIYFLDEKMAFSHSELEQALLNLVIEKLQHKAQFFYTTHNYDILDMNLPIHSYVFLIKNHQGSQFVQPELSFSKNDRTLLNYVKNNAFKTLPDTFGIDSLL